ncbi:hypothetical protein BSKO_01902 [Bryopsis sp. KO-2023]|nr:hypothetical protein BSKO_01902 [Bryopsis sp. KO-2023]
MNVSGRFQSKTVHCFNSKRTSLRTSPCGETSPTRRGLVSWGLQHRNVKSVPALNDTPCSNRREKSTVCLAAVHSGMWGNPGSSEDIFDKLHAFTEAFSNLFPVWLATAGIVGTLSPSTFAWMSTDSFTMSLALLTFSMGITLTVEDFKRCFSRPAPILVNFAACYCVMPLLGFAVGHLLGFSPSFIAGLVLIGATNGGQSSNLCTYIAKGDVALSVLMTMTTTLGCVFMTPLICKLLIGTMVPIDVMGMATSTVQIVLAPLMMGLTLNQVAPSFCRRLEPLCVLGGLCATIALVGGSLGQCSKAVMDAGVSLHFACILLHGLGGLAGYLGCKALGFSEKTNRTTAIETSMKSSAFGFLLASLHFGNYLVRVPAAVSVVWVAIVGSTLAVFWKKSSIEEQAQPQNRESQKYI